MKGESVYAVALSPDGKMALSASVWKIIPPDPLPADPRWAWLDTTVLTALKLWDTSNGKLIAFLARTNDFGHSTFSSDGKFVVSPLIGPKPLFNEKQSWTVRMWETKRREDLGAKSMSAEWTSMAFSCIALSPDGTRLATASGHDVSVWNLTTGKLVSQRSCQEECKVFRDDSVVNYWQIGSVAFSPDAKRVLVAGGVGITGAALMVDATTGKKTPGGFSVKGCIGAVSFAPDGEMVVGACSEGLRFWDARTGKTRFTLKD